MSKQDGLFSQYKRKQIAELRPVGFEETGNLKFFIDNNISISAEDLEAGSPRIGDMVARNPKNHKDQWLVAEEYFKDNFEELNNA